METQVILPDSEAPSTIREVVAALRKVNLEARHEAKDWGDWIHLAGHDTVISIESMRGLTSSATIEHAEGEEQGKPADAILKAFASIGWQGVDEDGPYPLA
ncbi:MAG: hypothetical protein R3242_07795 [Akkermansiaceae bacterium]|nr:hypothetical protein [Akkermansiaceae bacterium]